MEKAQVIKYAEYLNRAELDKKDVFRLTLENPDLTMEGGYEIQREIVRMKQAAGHKISGMKMGVTSEAKMLQMKISSRFTGICLTICMLLTERSCVCLSSYIQGPSRRSPLYSIKT